MFVRRKAADAFAALTFPISTSEITIAFEHTAHFEKQKFHSVAARRSRTPRGSVCVCVREGKCINEMRDRQCYLNRLNSTDPRQNTAPPTPRRPVFTPQPAEPNLIIFTRTPATASRPKHGINLKLNQCIESSDPIKVVQGKQNNCAPCDRGGKKYTRIKSTTQAKCRLPPKNK